MMKNKVLKLLIPVASMMLAAPAMADWPVAVADKFTDSIKIEQKSPVSGQRNGPKKSNSSNAYWHENATSDYPTHYQPSYIPVPVKNDCSNTEREGHKTVSDKHTHSIKIEQKGIMTPMSDILKMIRSDRI